MKKSKIIFSKIILGEITLSLLRILNLQKNSDIFPYFV